MARRAASLIAAVTLAACASLRPLESVVDQSHTQGDGLGGSVNHAFDLAGQSFVAGVSGCLTGVRVAVHENFPHERKLRVSIFEVADGVPTSNVLASTSLARSSSTLGAIVAIDPPLAVQQGRRYVLAVDYPANAPGPGLATWRGAVDPDRDPYPSGEPWMGNFRAGDDRGDVYWMKAQGEWAMDHHFETLVAPGCARDVTSDP